MSILAEMLVPATADQPVLPVDALEVLAPDSDAGLLLWLGFTVAVGIALAVDLAWGTSKAADGHHLWGAVISSIAWLGLGLVFAVFLAALKGGPVGFVFLTGYLVEKSLSVDNLVVMALIFRSFKIKPSHQGPVLKWGILGAVVFRAIFIFAGVVLMERFAGAVYVFGALLLWSAYKMFAEDDDDGDEHAVEAHRSGSSWMMKCLTAVVPYNAGLHGEAFMVKLHGKWHATPMLAALVVVELSDLLFAVDSVPCILGITQDLFLVFSSNMLAILGLRSLYMVLAEALEGIGGLKKGLAVMLAFVGLKMMLGHHFPLSQNMSLLVIFGILAVTIALSVLSGRISKGNSSLVLPG